MAYNVTGFSELLTPSNWGQNLAFEVPEEDILPVRPPALTEEWLLENEIDPPNWALRATRKIGGRKHPKRQVIYAMGPQGSYNPTQQWHGPLASDAEVYNRSISHSVAKRNRKKGQQANNEPAPRHVVPVGNLRNEDYRFWKGYPIEEWTGATCRWCGYITHNRDSMKRHHASGYYCKDRLLALFRFIKQIPGHEHFCMACRSRTDHFYYGFPLCNTTTCISRWRFSVREVLVGYMYYYHLAWEAQLKDPKTGPFKDIPETAVGPYGG